MDKRIIETVLDNAIKNQQFEQEFSVKHEGREEFTKIVEDLGYHVDRTVEHTNLFTATIELTQPMF